MILNCIAIDDEPLALEVIKTLCKNVGEINLTRTFTSTVEAAEYIDNFPVDLIFLDIEMPHQNGFDFFKGLKTSAKVIFVTAYRNFAVEGFEVNAIDYLVKPISLKRFESACEKAIKYFEIMTKSGQSPDDFIVVRSEFSLVKIPFKEISYLESMDDYVKIFHGDGKKTLTLSSMKRMMEKLPPNEFVRVHRSYVVPISKIKSVRAGTIFLDEFQIPIGSRYEKAFDVRFKSGGFSII